MKTLSALLLSLTVLLSAAHADNRDRDDHHDGRRGPRVILFQHADYSGGALVLYPGDSLDNFSGKTFDNGVKLNDGVSSIRVEGGIELFVYENALFRGEALRLKESVRDLTGRFVKGGVGVTWNDRISSAKVGGKHGGGGGDYNPKPRPPSGNPDKAIKAAFQDLLDREPSASELREFRGRFIDSGWDERMMRDYLRTDQVYRSDVANTIIRRAFLDLFGREPDMKALNSYREKLLKRNWTESDVRDDLRKSPEYKNRQK
jgi:hypothetical protein